MDHTAAPKIGDLPEFREWLATRQNKRVGFVGRTASCPLANWLRSLNPGRRINVCFVVGTAKAADADNPRNDYGGALFPLPKWAVDFADLLDQVIPTAPGERDVDGEQALAVLADVAEYEQ